MDKKIALIFQIHQPFRLKRYRFFDIGNDHYYFDDLQNEEIMQRVVAESYLPALRMLREMVEVHAGAFKVAFSISGTALDQIELYAPEVTDLLVELASRSEVEFLAMPYACGLASLFENKSEFKAQVQQHQRKLKLMLGQTPKVFQNSDLIYDDSIAPLLRELGFEGVLTEGAKHLLGWKSPNYLYQSCEGQGLKLLLRHGGFSEDITKNFSRYDWDAYPLTAEKLAHWLGETPKEEEIITLAMGLDTLGGIHKAESGIFDFFRALPHFVQQAGFTFVTPTEAVRTCEAKEPLHVAEPISWSEEERNTLSWVGNVLQKEAFQKLEEWAERTRLAGDRLLLQDWLYLQSADHFLYMSTQNNEVWRYSPYDSAYDAFSNYMNVLSDFLLRVEAKYPSSIENEELSALLTTIRNQDEKIQELEAELAKAKKRK